MRIVHEAKEMKERKMTRYTRFLSAAIFLVLLAGFLPAQGVDLSGTWVGETTVPNSQEKDFVTLILKKEASSYSGTVSDSLGMAIQSMLQRVKFENNTLTFEFTIYTGAQETRIYSTLKVNGEKMTGSWTSEAGDTGPLELQRKK